MMNISPATKIAFYHAGVAALVSVVFVVDAYTPPGLAVWLMYLLPLVFVSRFMDIKWLGRYTVVTGAIILAGHFLSEGAAEYDLANRATYVLVLASAAAMLKKGKEASEKVESLLKDQLALRETQEMFRLLFDNTIDAVLVDRPDGTILQCNRSAETLFGYTQDEMKGLGKASLVAPEDRRFDEFIANRDKHDRAISELTFVRKNGTKFEGEITSTLFEDRDGRTIATVIVRDISSRKKQELQRNEMISMVSHDLKSPLTTIIGYAELLLMKDLDISQDDREMIEIIYESGKKLSGMVEDFLLASKMDAGKIQLVKSEMDLSAMLTKVHKDFLGPAMKKRQEFVLEAGHLPEINADWRQLERAVSNLVGNAIKFTGEAGRVALTAGSPAVDGQDWVEIAVSDNGPGIPKEEADRVFDKYFRSTRTSGTKGTGLGLSIVKSIVDLHNGRVSVESEPGKGSTFRITLPVGLARTESLKKAG